MSDAPRWPCTVGSVLICGATASRLLKRARRDYLDESGCSVKSRQPRGTTGGGRNVRPLGGVRAACVGSTCATCAGNSPSADDTTSSLAAPPPRVACGRAPPGRTHNTEHEKVIKALWETQHQRHSRRFIRYCFASWLLFGICFAFCKKRCQKMGVNSQERVLETGYMALTIKNVYFVTPSGCRRSVGKPKASAAESRKVVSPAVQKLCYHIYVVLLKLLSLRNTQCADCTLSSLTTST